MNIRIWIIVVTLLITAPSVCHADDSMPEEHTARGGLPNVFAKLHNGEPVCIAYLGGSITEAQGWRPMSFEWFQQRYPDSTITQVNAAHSGTTSDLACFRLQRDCLHAKPDLLFVEFAVNDGIATRDRIAQGIEGIIRQARRANPSMDICIVYTLCIGWEKFIPQGKLPGTIEVMETVAQHYNLPSVHLGLEVVRMANEGTLVFKGKYPETEEEKAELGDRILFSCDGVHPLKEGHALYRDALARAMEQMESVGEPGPAPLPEPLRDDNFEYATPTPLERAQLTDGWRKLDPATNPLAKKFQAKLPELWLADKPGESITVRFKGTSILLYDVVGPDCGQIIITIDDKEPRVVSRFDAWSQEHRVYYLIAAAHLEDTEHLARFEIHPEQPDKAAILAKRGKTIDDPGHYDGTTWYVGDVLVTGEILVTGQALPAE